VVVQIEFFNGYGPPSELDRAALEKLESLLRPLLGRHRLRRGLPPWVPPREEDDEEDGERGKGERKDSDVDVDVDVTVAVEAYVSSEDGRRLWSICKTRLRGR
jgi:hypothetical protein